MLKNVPPVATATASLGTVCATPNLVVPTGKAVPEIWEIVGITTRATPRQIAPQPRRCGVQPKRYVVVSRAYRFPPAPNAVNDLNGTCFPRETIPANG